MATTTQLRTNKGSLPNNISFPIGSMLGVAKYYNHLELQQIFEKFKKKGIDINSLIMGLVSYKLTQNFSITKASFWMNTEGVRSFFKLDPFEQRTLFRVLEILGKNRLEIMFDLQDHLFGIYHFEHTDTNLDWTSLVLHGNKAKLGKFGYSREHRPDKKQITLGICELSKPINVPYGMTVNAGNVPDVLHFKDTYELSSRHMRKGSLVVFDKGPDSHANRNLILADKMKYLTAKKLNKSDEKRIKQFDRSKAVLVDAEKGVYGIKYHFPSRFDYFYYSEALKENQLITKQRQAERKLEEAKMIQRSLDEGKGLPKSFQIRNALVDVKYSYQTKLTQLSEWEALQLLYDDQITGREGFFCLKSTENLTLQEALESYRQKDSIEKIFHSLKSEIVIKPLRVWTNESIFGALLIGFLAQLFISLMRYDYEDLKHVATKFIKNSLSNLTVTIEYRSDGRKRYIYSNFDPLNQRIFGLVEAVT